MVSDVDEVKKDPRTSLLSEETKWVPLADQTDLVNGRPLKK